MQQNHKWLLACMRIIELQLGSYYLMVVALTNVLEIEMHVRILVNIKNIYKIPEAGTVDFIHVDNRYFSIDIKYKYFRC